MRVYTVTQYILCVRTASDSIENTIAQRIVQDQFEGDYDDIKAPKSIDQPGKVYGFWTYLKLHEQTYLGRKCGGINESVEQYVRTRPHFSFVRVRLLNTCSFPV